ncbi:hypothetical protein BC629DRAFT_1440504 [Irpex lacteus]|nr:hypothetical protein BC629DRAFT_1440504 [Irpex lacteus]
MRPATMLFHVLALVALAVIPSAMASPTVAARDASPVERRGGVPSPYYGRRAPAPSNYTSREAAPVPSGYYKREAAPVPSGYYKREAAPVPSGYYKRAPAPAPSGYRKRDEPQQQPITGEKSISQYLCPRPMRACPVSPQSSPVTVEQLIQEGFECVDDREDLTSCGGCGLSDSKYDCTTIEGAVGVLHRRCMPRRHLRAGYTLALDGKTCLKV